VNEKYLVIFTEPAERAYRKLDRGIQRRVLAKAETRSENPFPAGVIKLTGYDAYRMRVGDYRLIYTVQHGKLLVLVLDAGHRREVYRDL
jgi:mRNA interferase RelE/StbE